MKSNIEVYLTKNQYTRVLTDAKVFKPKGRFKFIQNLSWKFLTKTRCLTDYYDRVYKVTRINIDKQKIIDKVLNHYYNVSYGKEPTTIFIGPEELSEFLYDKEAQNLIDFGPFDFNIQTYEKYKILNLKVNVVPYMKGILIV